MKYTDPMICQRDRYPEGQNQCDGCLAGLPVQNDGPHPTHSMGISKTERKLTRRTFMTFYPTWDHLQRAVDKGRAAIAAGDWSDLHVNVGYDGGEARTIVVNGLRLETDHEVLDRLRYEKVAAERERAEYERLRAKYG